MFLSAKTPLLAVDIGSNSIKVGRLLGTPGKFELSNFGMMPLDPESVVEGVVQDEDHVVDALTRLVHAENVDTPYAVASVAGEAVMIKKIKVPMMSKQELEEFIPQEAEQYIPFDIDDVRIDFQILEGVSTMEEHEFEEEEDKQEILLVAVQNEIIDSRSNVLTAAGLKPCIIDLDVFAIVNAISISRNLQDMGSVALMDLGGAFTHLNILMDGVTSYTRDIPIGQDACTTQLMAKYEMEYRESESIKVGAIPEDANKEEIIDLIIESYEPILEELHKSFEFFSTTSNSQVERAFLCGGGAMIPGVDGLLSDRLGVPVEIFNPLEAVKLGARKFDPQSLSQMAPMATVALGLATRRFDYI
ncbi:MAG: type IV pilus assembly protein PilM [Nitrospinae bacterium]|nr:type IV pilus assembly protein PilM [Nitrospinota bacterium]